MLAILVADMNFKANYQMRSSNSSLHMLKDNQISGRRQGLEPVRVMEQYLQWHGVDALGQEVNTTIPSTEIRKYAVAYLFPCSARAGNQFHNFYNSVLWAVITNRTLLIRFDSPTQQLCAGQPKVKVAPWLPLWDDWVDKLRLFEDDIEPVPIDTKRELTDRAHRVVLFPQIPDVRLRENHIFRGRWIDHPVNHVFGPRVRWFYGSSALVSLLLLPIHC